MFKVDYEKAYDLVSWDFLLYMIHRLSFGGKWIGLSKQGLQSTNISVLVNGSQPEKLHHKNVLRQGDPLVLLLFTIVAKG